MELAMIVGIRTAAQGIGERKLKGVMTQVPTLSEAKDKWVNITLQQTFGVNNTTNKETINWSLVKTFTKEGLSGKEAQDNLPAAEMNAFIAKDYYTKEWVKANEDGTLIKDKPSTDTSTDTSEAPAAAEEKPTGKLF